MNTKKVQQTNNNPSAGSIKPLINLRLIGGFQDTRTNKEDFALTPYLFGVWLNGEIIKVYGIGVCWGYYSVYLGLGWNIPKGYPSFKILSKNSH